MVFKVMLFNSGHELEIEVVVQNCSTDMEAKEKALAEIERDFGELFEAGLYDVVVKPELGDIISVSCPAMK